MEPAAAQGALPAAEPSPAVRNLEPEPGTDFDSLAPARARRRTDIELEEGLYE